MESADGATRLSHILGVPLADDVERQWPQMGEVVMGDPEHDPMIPYTLVLKPGLVIHSIYHGYWFWGRPSFYDLWHDLRAATAEIRPDWDLGTPRLREAWSAVDYSFFHGWDRRSSEPLPAT